jgi:hypothetical protein
MTERIISGLIEDLRNSGQYFVISVKVPVTMSADLPLHLGMCDIHQGEP